MKTEADIKEFVLKEITYYEEVKKGHRKISNEDHLILNGGIRAFKKLLKFIEGEK